MYIEKIEVPAFRVLRDVVLEFGEAYDPQVFPIGSENGGGKSTLLQLVFSLLHCSTEPARLSYLANLLASDVHGDENPERLIARLTVRIGAERHSLEFVSLTDRFLSQKLDEPLSPLAGFNAQAELTLLRRNLAEAERKFTRYHDALERCKTLPLDREVRTDRELYELLGGVLPYRFARDVRSAIAYITSDIERMRDESQGMKERVETLSADLERVSALLVALNYKHVTNYVCSATGASQTRALICRCPQLNLSKMEEFLRLAACKVFLLGPSNQQYLFLAADTRKALLGAAVRRSRVQSESEAPPRPQIEYLTKLDAAESAIAGFYPYDWLSVEPLVRLFASARDEDFKNVVKTGSYGTSYTTLIREVNGLLLGKRVRPLDDLSGVEFIVVNNEGQETALRPEDLSQGELKRLMIYAWLRASNAVDAVVLIDEIEASFHPDWQVGIVRDLQDWAPQNQYLLATHSYELCQALTPRHVRELQPRLRR